MQHLYIVHFLPITLPRELQLHGAFYIGSVQLKKNLIVLWSDDDDDCCDGGGAGLWLWCWGYLK